MKIGDRIELLEMPDDPCPIPIGTQGIIELITPVFFCGKQINTEILVKWDIKRSLRVIIPPDKIKVVS